VTVSRAKARTTRVAEQRQKSFITAVVVVMRARAAHSEYLSVVRSFENVLHAASTDDLIYNKSHQLFDLAFPAALTNGVRLIQHQFVVPEQFSTAPLSFYSQLQLIAKMLEHDPSHIG
jgi:hypothetical protein